MTKAEIHLDADTLSAFAEHSLRADEETAVFSHLANCGTCRDYLAANSQLQDFPWDTGRTTNSRLPRSVRTAAGIAAAAAALWLLFPMRPAQRELVLHTSQVSVHETPLVGQPHTVKDSSAILAKKSSGRQLRVQRLNSRPITPKPIAPWEAVLFRKLATDDLLAARNSKRFLHEVTLATVSFDGLRTAEGANYGVSGRNQIVIKTVFGERLITMEKFRGGSAQ